MKRRWFFVPVALVILAFAMVQAQLSRDITDELESSSVGRAFLQAYSALKSDYLTEVDDEIILRGAIDGMLEALDDPYTGYRRSPRC